MSHRLLQQKVYGFGLFPAFSRPYGRRILRTLQRVPRSLTKRYEPVFTRLAAVKVSLRLATYQHVSPPSSSLKKTKPSNGLRGLIARMTAYERSSNNF